MFIFFLLVAILPISKLVLWFFGRVQWWNEVVLVDFFGGRGIGPGNYPEWLQAHGKLQVQAQEGSSWPNSSREQEVAMSRCF